MIRFILTSSIHPRSSGFLRNILGWYLYSSHCPRRAMDTLNGLELYDSYSIFNAQQQGIGEKMKVSLLLVTAI